MSIHQTFLLFLLGVSISSWLHATDLIDTKKARKIGVYMTLDGTGVTIKNNRRHDINVVNTNIAGKGSKSCWPDEMVSPGESLNLLFSGSDPRWISIYDEDLLLFETTLFDDGPAIAEASKNPLIYYILPDGGFIEDHS